MFYFELAYTLKKSVQEILRLPEWELYCWRAVFKLHGPFGWRREDWSFAKVYQMLSTSNIPLEEFLMFPDPKKRIELLNQQETEEEKMAALGYVEGR